MLRAGASVEGRGWGEGEGLLPARHLIRAPRPLASPAPLPVFAPPPQALQKRLISKTEEVVERDLQIQVGGRAA